MQCNVLEETERDRFQNIQSVKLLVQTNDSLIFEQYLLFLMFGFLEEP